MLQECQLKNFAPDILIKRKTAWVEKTKKSNGRECEVIVKSYNLANPQWTRTYDRIARMDETWVSRFFQN